LAFVNTEREISNRQLAALSFFPFTTAGGFPGNARSNAPPRHEGLRQHKRSWRTKSGRAALDAATPHRARRHANTLPEIDHNYFQLGTNSTN
jgi:hypothetical protein